MPSLSFRPLLFRRAVLCPQVKRSVRPASLSLFLSCFYGYNFVTGFKLPIPPVADFLCIFMSRTKDGSRDHSSPPAKILCGAPVKVTVGAIEDVAAVISVTEVAARKF